MKNAFCRVAPSSGTVTLRATLRIVACVAAVGGALALTQTFAKDPVEQTSSKLKTTSAAATAEAAAIPECFEKLKLSHPQQTQAKEIIHKYDAKLDAVWKQFGAKYMETVRTEVSLLAAVEDHLTEAQQTKVRDERRKVAHAEKSLEGTDTKPNKATAKPVDPVEQEVAGVGISLTSEQEAAADKIHHQYVGHLRSLNRDIQGIHTRLVSLEADKLVELEKLLTKEQLTQLREHRQTMGNAQKVTATDKAPTTTK